jgi:hypothetical protein
LTLCRYDPQKSGVRIPGCRYSGHDPALQYASAQSALYRRHPGQAARDPGWPTESRGNRGQERIGAPALVEA